ncbi:phage tail protein [Caldimonas sp. KR1-144]|uniref:phage tail protein n=1 Tax=Caldimonas sp. KR1-144 TaxID=3400911 RepID=UPI003C0C5C0B
MALGDQYIGEIRFFAISYAPEDWLPCDGRLLPIAGNEALFSLIGTTFGGNGVNNFALPDFRGRFPIGSGQGPDLSRYNLGQYGGQENVVLLQSQMPSHTHVATYTQKASNSSGTTYAPGGAVPAVTASGDGRGEFASYAIPSLANTGMATGPVDVESAGGASPVPLLSPYLGVTVAIAVNGLFPNRP